MLPLQSGHADREPQRGTRVKARIRRKPMLFQDLWSWARRLEGPSSTPNKVGETLFGLGGLTASSSDREAAMTHEFLSRMDAAEYLGVTERQISRWSQQGRLASTRLGNRTLFTREGLDDFVRANTRQAVAS